MTRQDHPATRSEALTRLSRFVPLAGRDYAAKRNYDVPGHPHVSVLSPYIRHRQITEEEVLEAVLGRYAPSTAQKFIQEVFWRTYWKGWLQLRPTVWASYQNGVKAALDRVATEGGLRSEWEAACKGETGIDAFDHWARELVETGYLHNHARMWFASIWIFTLRLPWELGADFFLRHLLDGDPASNTLGWKWVAGLQTLGKNYVARSSNIARYTEGRFNPSGLADNPAPLDGAPHPARMAPPESDDVDPSLRTGLLLHEDDLSPGYVLSSISPRATASILSTQGRSPLEPSPAVAAFSADAIRDATTRFADRIGTVTHPTSDIEDIVDWAQSNDLQQVVTPFAPIGPASDQLALLAGKLPDGIRLAQVIRPYDATCWPAATAGFFKFKERIPKFIDTLNLKAAA